MIDRSALAAPRLLLGVIVVVAALVRLYGLDFGLPHTQARPDETHIIEAARLMLSGRLPRFYDYPWLYIVLLSALYLGYYAWGAMAGWFDSVAAMVASWPEYWTPFFLISRAFSALCGTVTVLVVYRLARRLWGETAGLVAALFMALAFIHVRDSHFGTTDVALTLFIVGSVAGLVEAHQSQRQRAFAVAGLVGGLGAAIKYNAVILAAPIAASYVLHVSLSHDRGRALRDPRLLSYGVPFALGFAIGIPFVFFDYGNFQRAMVDLQSSMAHGDPRLGLANGWVHHLTQSLRYGAGLPLLVAGLAGSVLLVLRAPVVSVLLLTFPLTYYAVAGSIRNLYFRYAIPIVPFLCLAAAYLVVEAAQAASRRQQLKPPAARALAAVAALALIASSALDVWRFDRIIGRTDSRVLVADFLAERASPGATFVQSGSRYGLAQIPRQVGMQEWRWDGPTLSFRDGRAAAQGAPDWVVVQESPLPSATQQQVTDWLAGDYELVTAIRAYSPKATLVYDRQDMFYVPFAGLQYVTRPGPNFAIYARRGTASEARAVATP